MLYLTSIVTLVSGMFLMLNAPMTLARSDTISCITLNFDISCNRPFFADFQIWLQNSLKPDDLIGKIKLSNRHVHRQQARWHKCLDSGANFLKFNTLDLSLSVKNQTCVDPWYKFEEMVIVEHQIDSNHTYVVRWDMSACSQPQVLEVE